MCYSSIQHLPDTSLSCHVNCQLPPPISLLWFHHPLLYVRPQAWRRHPGLTSTYKILQQTLQHFLFLTSTNSCRFSKSKVNLFAWFTWLDLDQGWNLSAQIIECTQIRKTANISARHTSHISCPTHCEQSQNISHCEITAEPGCLLRGPLWPNWLDG